jgi:hypothetical protein
MFLTTKNVNKLIISLFIYLFICDIFNYAFLELTTVCVFASFFVITMLITCLIINGSVSSKLYNTLAIM